MKRLTALMLALVLAWSMTADAWALPQTDAVRLSSADDFALLAENCRLDTYSAGKTFLLTADVELDESYTPIPYFAGAFDGGGHTVSGLSLGGDGSRQGLFRQIARGGTVKNLTLRGDVTPGGSGEYVGGIAGINRGRITGCTFSGYVRGIQSVGGIAGLNDAGGVIEGCTFTGRAAGEHRVGGIAGDNRSVIAGCSNAGRVNNEVVTVATASFDISLLTGAGEEDILDITDIGGIAGLNTGTLRACRSDGAVGYTYTGYNVGGIVGRTSGYVDGCTAAGTVLGRRDVGGIAGQLEPYTAWDLSDSKLKALRTQLLELDRLTGSANADASHQNALMTKNLGDLRSGINKAVGEIDAILDIDGDGVVSASDLTGSWTDIWAQVASDEARAHWTAAWEGIKASFTAASALSDNASAALSAANGHISAITGQMSRITDTLYSMLERMGQGHDDMMADISIANAYSRNDGAISNCTASGSVSADASSGGIAGSMAFEISFDLESTLDLSDYLFTDARYLVFACIRGCTSLGDTAARSESAGGVVGRMDLGAAVDCVAGGAVTTEKGGYTGGIAGQARGSLLRCCARTLLSGKRYVGGIAGLAADMAACRSYSRIKEAAEYSGAVAGWSDGTVKDCLFVEDGLGGIDGVSYTGQAQPVSYAQMLQQDDIPDLFRTITVTFEKDGRTVAQIEVPYGGAVEALPAVENRGADYWKWDESFDSRHVYYSTVVTGAYHRAITTLAWGDEPAAYLAEGVFYEEDRLCITPADMASLALPDWCSTLLSAAAAEVPGYEGELKLHIRAESKGLVFVLENGGSYAPVKTVQDGHYLVFTVPNGSTFVLAQGLPSLAVPLLLGVALPVVLAVVNALLRRGKPSPGRRRKKA